MLRPICSLIVIVLVYSHPQTGESDGEPEYTENLEEFKGKAFGVRIEKLLACWLYLRENFQIGPRNLPILKKCMQKISRREAITKITSLAEGNLKPVKKIEELLTDEQLLSGEAQMTETTPFDQFVLQKSKYFENQMQQMSSKGAIKDQVQQELKKRQQFFFGLIPAGVTTHSIILVTISIIMMCCCTWCKFWRATSHHRKLKKQGQKMQAEIRPSSQFMKPSLKNSSLTRAIKPKKI